MPFNDVIFPGEEAKVYGESNLPGNLDITLWQGDYLIFDVILKDGNNERVKLQGYTAKAQVRRSYGSTPIISFDVTVLEDKCTLYLPSDRAALLSENEYIWDFQVTDSVGTKTLLAGDVSVPSDVTR